MGIHACWRLMVEWGGGHVNPGLLKLIFNTLLARGKVVVFVGGGGDIALTRDVLI